MKRAVIIVLLALLIGGIRHARLKELHQKVGVLDERIVSTPGSVSLSASGRLRNEAQSGEQAISQAIPPGLAGRLRDEFAIRNRPLPQEPGRNAAVIERALIRELSMLDHHLAAELFKELRSGGVLVEGDPDGLRDYGLALFAIANPPQALTLLENNPSLADRGDRAANAFKRWALHRPGEAITWFEGIEEKGSTLAVEPRLVQEMIRIQCRIDPAKAMARIHGADGDSVPRLGEIVAKDLRSGREHQQFFSALQKAEVWFPESNTIQQVRSGYVQRLTESVHLWPFEEAAALVGAFRPVEREKLVQSIGGARLLGDPERWAEWVAHADLPSGRRHPLATLVKSWAERDPDASGDWLDKMPAGTLRDEAAYEYAVAVAEMDPQSAAIRALTIGDETRRNHLLKSIRGKWNAADSAAASEFFKDRGIGE